MEITVETYDIQLVKKQYRKLSKRYHPDSHDKPDAAMFRLITEAKDLLLAQLEGKSSFSYTSHNSNRNTRSHNSTYSYSSWRPPEFNFRLINVQFEEEENKIVFTIKIDFQFFGDIELNICEEGYTHFMEQKHTFRIEPHDMETDGVYILPIDENHMFFTERRIEIKLNGWMFHRDPYGRQTRYFVYEYKNFNINPVTRSKKQKKWWQF